MKQLTAGLILSACFISCRNNQAPLVTAVFADSLVSHYTEPPEYRSNEADLLFWKKRIDPAHPGLVNELRYASALVQRFHLSGDVSHLVAADSVLHLVDSIYDHKEPAPVMALLRNSILQHQFKKAGTLLEVARKANLKPYDDYAATFDVSFELGQYLLAETSLKKISSATDYGYHFRRAKMAHYKGELDSAIAAMNRAAEMAGPDISLQQAALSNTADLELHNGNLQRAAELYLQSIRLSTADLHSIIGLGWISLVHDKNDSLAERLFLFVQSKTKAPDILYKLSQVAEARGDTVLQKKYALQFAAVVTEPVYGNMYNKYLIELYTGVLREPMKAEALAENELNNRATPQTQAWVAWAHYCNGRIADADNVYKQYVSGKPLEGLELFWMGKMMQGLKRGYNAQQFFKAAYKNRYDLAPGMVKDLQKALAE